MSENGEEQEVKKLPDPIPGKSIFLSHCNTYEGRAIF
jgi:adenylate kinase